MIDDIDIYTPLIDKILENISYSQFILENISYSQQRDGDTGISMLASPNGNIFRVTGPLRGIHQLTVNSPQKGQSRGVLMMSLICAWTNVEQTTETPIIWSAIALIITSL